MDYTTIKGLSDIINDNINNSISTKEAKIKINGLLHNKTTENTILEFKSFLDTIPDDKKRDIPKMTLILVLALCRRNLDEEDKIYIYLKENGLIEKLFGGLSILLDGKSKTLGISVKWADNNFKNKYEFISRFQGQFEYWTYIEIFQATDIIYRYNKNMYEDLLIKDKARLLLLNLFSSIRNKDISKSLIIRLLNKEDELDQNIGLYIITYKLRNYIFQYKNHQIQNEMGSFNSNNSREKLINIEENISREILEVEHVFSMCEDEVKVGLLINYILSEKEYIPEMFILWILDPKLESILIDQIKYSGKINTLEKVFLMINIIGTNRPKNTYEKSSKIKLYDALIYIITEFIRERNGIYSWTEREEEMMSVILKKTPMRPRKRLLAFLEKEKEGLMSSRLDELVRLHVCLKDKTKSDIINGIKEIIQTN